MDLLLWIALILGGFLLGNIMFSQLIPALVLKKDIRDISVDNNPGAFNVFKHCGVKLGMLCLFLDMLKGFVPVFVASMLLPADGFAFSLVMFAPIMGHAIGMFNHFHGGKCIATAFGVLLGIIPVSIVAVAILATFYILFSTLLKIKNAAKRSVFVFALFMISSCTLYCFIGLPFVAIGCGSIALTVIVKFLCSKNGLADNKFRDAPQNNK